MRNLEYLYIVESDSQWMTFTSKQDAIRQYQCFERGEYSSRGLKLREIKLDDSQYLDVSNPTNLAIRDVNRIFRNIPYTTTTSFGKITCREIKGGVSVCLKSTPSQLTPDQEKVVRIYVRKRVREFSVLYDSMNIKVNLNGRKIYLKY